MHYKSILKRAKNFGCEIRRGDYVEGVAQINNNYYQWYVDPIGEPRRRTGPGHATIAAAYDAILGSIKGNVYPWTYPPTHTRDGQPIH